VLAELNVENLLLIERASLRLAPGLNVITGETGAGKTVLANALDLLLGGRARAGIVRPGAEEAYVEGVFELPEGLRAELGDRIPAGAEELVLARRVAADGRTRAYVGGRAANVGDLRDLGARLIAFYGQHEHRRLTLASAQLEILDAAAGPGQQKLRGQFAALHGRHGEIARELERLREIDGARERELDLLSFEIGEIEALAPDAAEWEELMAERGRLRHLDGLRAATAGAGAAIAGADDDEGGALARLATAERELDALAGVDPDLDALAARQRGLRLELEDLAGELRRYEEAIDATPGRLEQVEARSAELERLMRKHGGTIAAVLEHCARCVARRDELLAASSSIAELENDLAAVQRDLDRLASKLSKARAGAAAGLAPAVRAVLDELAMGGAAFDVEIARRDRGPTGDDAVEFRIAPNPGVPAGPLREIASGGELSRVMLALMSVAADGGGADGPGVLVFDEVDAGIGGVTAKSVGARLRSLAERRQVLCITHLPQVASHADRHFRVWKDPRATPALTSVTELRAEEVVAELARMLGADGEDEAARRHAEQLLAAA
jgi:DNA repair protein RecN (Recombination protein N)